MELVQVPRIDLQTAAGRLGVHYQTAYRWVRIGRLNADKVNGRYVVSPEDLALLDESRRMPSAPPAPKSKRLGSGGNRMYAALLNGDETAATKIGRRLAEEGAPIQDLIQNVFAPSLARIGEQWHAGELTIWQEHRASSIVERLIGTLAPNPRGRRRGTALVAAIAGDRHSLPTTMAAVALRADNWQVHHLGADLPGEQIEQFCSRHDMDLAVLTVTNLDVRGVANSTAQALRMAGTTTIVGGAGEPVSGLLAQARDALKRA